MILEESALGFLVLPEAPCSGLKDEREFVDLPIKCGVGHLHRLIGSYLPFDNLSREIIHCKVDLGH